jgi:acylphosphatase
MNDAGKDALNDTGETTADDRERITVLLTGNVQGVGMRQFIQRRALDLNLAGYVENLGDGRVEVVAEGHREDLELLLVKMKVGPAHAEVTDMEVNWSLGGTLRGFHAY